MTDTPNPLTTDELAPIAGQPDTRFAGTALDSWLGFQPDESVVKAIEIALGQPDVRVIAFVMVLPVDEFRGFIKQQHRAAKAYLAEQHPNVRGLRTRTTRAPFRGLGSDVQVFYAVLDSGKARKADS